MFGCETQRSFIAQLVERVLKFEQFDEILVEVQGICENIERECRAVNAGIRQVGYYGSCRTNDAFFESVRLICDDGRHIQFTSHRDTKVMLDYVTQLRFYPITMHDRLIFDWKPWADCDTFGHC